MTVYAGRALLALRAVRVRLVQYLRPIGHRIITQLHNGNAASVSDTSESRLVKTLPLVHDVIRKYAGTRLIRSA